MARTTAVVENGHNVYATGGSATQEGKLKIYVCNTDGQEVVWATSKKTGKFYLVDVQRGYHGQRYYAKHRPHNCAEVMRQAVKTAEMFNDPEQAGRWQARLDDLEKGKV